MPGAALLAARAAMRVGAGKLQLAACESVAPAIAVATPEARVVRLAETPDGGMSGAEAGLIVDLARRAAAVVVGPGLQDEEAIGVIVAALLDDVDGPPLVIDAGALAHLDRRASTLRRRRGRVVLTPHAGEMATCLGMDIEAVKARPLETARRAAERFGAVVALKGAGAHICAPDGRAWLCDRGNVGLATSGSGDTLAGFIAGFMARGADAATACVWGVFVHGEAGARLARRLGPLGYLARELPDEAPAILAHFDRA
jgi:ADP-dependent NAD(P)H-hydrate dehydratase